MCRNLTPLLMLAAVAASAQPDPLIYQGPDAPDAVITWDGGFRFTLDNPVGSNNEGLYYQEIISALSGTDHPTWVFQGYLFYQVADDDFHIREILDPSRARLFHVLDLADGVTDLTGVFAQFVPDGEDWVFDSCIPEHIAGTDSGLDIAVTSTTDAFTGEPWKESSSACFVVLAYAHNPIQVDPHCDMPDEILFGRTRAFGGIWAQCVSGPLLVAQQEEPAWTVGPVPANDRIGMQANTVLEQVEAYDALGALVAVVPVRSDRTELDVSGWAEGAYLLRAYTANGTLARPIVVVR